MHLVVAASIALGLLFGLAGAYALGAWVTHKLAPWSRCPQLVNAAAWVGALLSAIPAFFGAFVIGGNMGGSAAAAFVGTAAVPIGLAAGIAAVFAVSVAAGATAGAVIAAAAIMSRAR